jgi:DNA-binding protein HU-beta
MIQHLQNGETIAIQNFGSFEIRKKAERISVNPATKKRMFVPPKLTLTYKPNASLKDKLKFSAVKATVRVAPTE